MDNRKSSVSPQPDHHDVREKAKQLSELICHTEEYQTYQEALLHLKKYEALYNRFNEFRAESMAMNFAPDTEEERQDLPGLLQSYDDVLNNPMVQTFLSAEQGVCRMLREVYDQLARHVSVDLSFMEG